MVLKCNRVVLGVVVSVAFFLLPGFKAEAASDASVSVDLISAYVYHGVTYNDGYVIQSYLDVPSKWIGLSVFANLDIDDYGGTLKGGDFSEVDLNVYHARSMAGFDFCLTLSEYLYPNVTNSLGGPLPNGRELILTVSRKVVGGLTAKAECRYEIDEIEDFYAALKLSYAFAPVMGIDFGIGALAGYCGKDISYGGKEGFNECTLSATASYKVTESFTINAAVYNTTGIDRDVLPEQDVETYGSLGFFVML